MSKSGTPTSIYTFPDNYTGAVQVTYMVFAESGTVLDPNIVHSGNTRFLTTIKQSNIEESNRITTGGASLREAYIAFYEVRLPNLPGQNTLTFTFATASAVKPSCNVMITEVNSQYRSITDDGELV
jgi:hypothetical protein